MERFGTGTGRQDDGSGAVRARRASDSRMAGLAEELGYPASVPCVFCEGVNTELHSPFGSALSVATYWCRDCRTAFEWIKWG